MSRPGILSSLLYVGAIGALTWAVSAQAETVIKLDLGSTSEPDIQLVSGAVSTFRDAAATAGDQKTNVEFSSFLEATVPDIVGGSFTLKEVSLVGAPTDLGPIVTQNTSGGAFEIFDASGVSLLTGTLNAGVLIGPPTSATVSATGSFLTATMGDFTGPAASALYTQLAPDSASISISLTNVQSAGGGKGLTIIEDGAAPFLGDFVAGATANIAAVSASDGNNLPEPAGLTLALFGLLGALSLRRRSS